MDEKITKESVTKKNIWFLISMILGLLYIIYLTISVSTDVGNGGLLAMGLLLPHIVLVSTAIIFNFVVYLTDKKWAGITTISFYVIGALSFPLYKIMVSPMIILSVIGFIRMNEKEK